MKKPVIAMGVAFLLLVLAVLIYSSMNLTGKRVEVCVSFRGATACRIASGTTEEFALRTATTNACAQVSSGVTDSLACEHSSPVKVTWLK